MKICILAIGGFLVLTCFPLNGQADCLHERGQQNPLPENLPFNANAVIQRIRSNSHPQPFPFYHSESFPFSYSECNEESKYNKWLLEDEFLIDTNLVYGPAAYDLIDPAVAFDGANYLVVWSDWRNSCDADIYGARVNQSGIMLDSTSIIICSAARYQEIPSIAFDGVNYLVVWQDYRSGSSHDIYGARVSQAGVVLDSAGILISAAANNQYCPVAAFDGTHYLVVWIDSRSGFYFDIYGARVSQAGIVLDTAGVAISTEVGDQEYPAVAFDGNNYFVVWSDMRGSANIYGARVSQAGVVLDSAGILISAAANDQYCAAVAFDGINYLVTWDDLRSGSSWDVYGARVSQTGVVLDSAGIAISTAANGQHRSAVGFDGTNYLVAWQDDRGCTYNFGIYGARVSQAGAVLDSAGILISVAVNGQYRPAVAFDGISYLVTWDDLRSGSSHDIYGARVSQAGVVLDSAGILISAAANNQYCPVAAFDGTHYLVVWIDSRSGFYFDIYGARVSQAGVVLDSTGILISAAANDQYYPAVAFDGTNYLVVWEDYRNGGYPDIYGTRVSQAGVVIDTAGIAISSTVYRQSTPSVAFDGINYLIVWEDDSTYDIRGARISQAGIVLDSAGITVSTAGRFQEAPSVTFDGVNYLVVWQDWRNSPWYSDIYGARVSQAGVVLDTEGLAICTTANDQLHPFVSFDGINYLAIWEHFQSGSSYDIYGAKISPAGVVLNTYPISTQPHHQVDPALARGNGDQILIAYSGWCDSINSHPANTMRIWGKFYPFTGIAEDAGYTVQDVGSFLQVHPNPFKEETDIGWHIPDVQTENPEAENRKTSLKIYDATGRLVRDFLRSTNYELDNTQIVWHGDDDFGRVVPAGVYFIMAETAGYAVSKKVVLLK